MKKRRTALFFSAMAFVANTSVLAMPAADQEKASNFGWVCASVDCGDWGAADARSTADDPGTIAQEMTCGGCPLGNMIHCAYP